MNSDKYKQAYEEAGHYIRLANTVTWNVAAVIFPIALSCMGLAINFPEYKVQLAIGSFYLFLFWVYVSVYYGFIAANLRKAMMKIESEEWKLEKEKGFYLSQGLIGYKFLGLRNFSILNGILFAVSWFLIL